MPKLACTILLIIVSVVGLITINTVPLGRAQNGQTVNGMISSDTTWTKANSPYTLTGPVAVNKGTTLTIEPVVTVNLNGHYIRVNGTLIAKGNSTNNNIHFNNGSIEFTAVSAVWDSQTGFGSIIENAVINGSLTCYGSPMVSQNTIKGAISVNGGAPIINQNTLSGWIIVQAGSPIISKNILIGGYSFGIGISNGNAIVVDNTISGSFPDAAVAVGGGSPTIERNLISNNLSYSAPNNVQTGLRVSGSSNPIIKQNTIIKNLIGIYLDGTPRPTIVNNNVEDNSYNVRLRSSTEVNIDASNNWWGTTDRLAIDQKIYDYNDDLNLGKVTYTPFLTEANPQALPDPNAAIPTPNAIDPIPTSPSQNQTPPPNQVISRNVVIIALCGIIVVLLVIVFVFLKKQKHNLEKK